MKVQKIGIMALALGVPFAAAACDDNGTSSEFGQVSLQLTDAEGDEVVEAQVTFTDIYLQGEGGDEDPPGGRVFLMADGSETFELTSLANSVADLVDEVEVPAGTYGQLRIVLSGACIETADGRVFASDESYTLCGAPTGELRMPSMQQSGVKVLLNGLEVTGGQHILLLDFDVADSFGHAAGNSGAWVMTPVIHTSEVGLTGGVDVTLSAGDVTLPGDFTLGDFSATMLPTDGDSARVAFEDEDADGVFDASFLFLIPEQGPVDIRLNAPDGLTVTVDPDSPATLELNSGEVTELNWVLQSAAETPQGG